MFGVNFPNMLPNVSAAVALVFAFTTVATVLLFLWAVRLSANERTQAYAKRIFIGLVAWVLLQGSLSLNHLYSTDLGAMPPKIALFGLVPTLVAIVGLFATAAGRRFMDGLPLRPLTYLHAVRVPVEVVLFLLFGAGAIPELMTFAGRNFDIVAGLTAPLVAYWGFTKPRLGRRVLLGWNIVCLGLLLNIVIHALLAAPTPLQQLAFERPNIGVLYFPFSWLPTVVVPLVLLAHLVAIRQLTRR
jgi:hypothetical protein